MQSEQINTMDKTDVETGETVALVLNDYEAVACADETDGNVKILDMCVDQAQTVNIYEKNSHIAHDDTNSNEVQKDV